jgi:hypothetical protein
MRSLEINFCGGISLVVERWAVVPEIEVRFLYSALN